MRRLYIFVKKLKNFSNKSWKDKELFFEAFVLSGITRIAILCMSFKKLRKHMGIYNNESPLEIDEGKYKIISRVAWAMSEAAQYTPWESKCLVQALTVQQMLKMRKIYSTIYLGVNKDKKNNMLAHAWLRCGEIIVTGGNVISDFKQVAKFSNYKII